VQFLEQFDGLAWSYFGGKSHFKFLGRADPCIIKGRGISDAPFTVSEPEIP
jgi:hypothetical protein